MVGLIGLIRLICLIRYICPIRQIRLIRLMNNTTCLVKLRWPITSGCP